MPAYESTEEYLNSTQIGRQIIRIRENVSDALTAIGNKGVAVPQGANSDDLAALIGAIETGGRMWKDKNTCFFGDSIGAGYGNNNESFVDIIEDTGIFASVHKNCVSGTTTSTLYGRMLESATELASADIVYCDYEGNDINALMAGTLTTAQLETALRQAITYLRSINTTASVVWLPLTVYHFDKIGGANASYYKQWAEVMLPVFAELGINVIPIYDTLGAGHAQQDGRHPNATGHQIIAELVMQMPLGSSIYQPDILSEWTGGSY